LAARSGFTYEQASCLNGMSGREGRAPSEWSENNESEFEVKLQEKFFERSYAIAKAPASLRPLLRL